MKKKLNSVLHLKIPGKSERAMVSICVIIFHNFINTFLFINHQNIIGRGKLLKFSNFQKSAPLALIIRLYKLVYGNVIKETII